MAAILRTPYLLVAIGFIVLAYVLCAIEYYGVFSAQGLTWIIHQHMLTNS